MVRRDGRLKRRSGGVAPDGLPVIEGFRIDQQIGEGGFSQVYQGAQETPARPAAIKLFRTSGKVGARVRERFRRESDIIGELSSLDGLVTVFTGGFSDAGVPYLAMELCKGGSIAHRIGQYGPLPVDEVLAVGERIGSALANVHARGVTHRDVKPSNILLTADGRAMLTDFGLSVVGEMTDALGEESRLAMTEVYAPPERLDPSLLDGQGTDAAGDQYSLALTLYAMLLGGSPFTGATTTKRALKALQGDREPLGRSDVPSAVMDVLSRAMAISPLGRWPSMNDLVLSLRDAATPTGQHSAGMPSWIETPVSVDPQRPWSPSPEPATPWHAQTAPLEPTTDEPGIQTNWPWYENGSGGAAFTEANTLPDRSPALSPMEDVSPSGSIGPDGVWAHKGPEPANSQPPGALSAIAGSLSAAVAVGGQNVAQHTNMPGGLSVRATSSARHESEGANRPASLGGRSNQQPVDWSDPVVSASDTPHASAVPVMPVESTRMPIRDYRVSDLEAGSGSDPDGKRRLFIALAAVVLVVVVGVTAAVVLGRGRPKEGSSQDPAKSSLVGSTADAQAAPNEPELPTIDGLKLIDNGLAFTWSGDPLGTTAMYQMLIDQSETTDMLEIDTNTAGDPVKEQFVTEVALAGDSVQPIDPDSHEYCIVVVFTDFKEIKVVSAQKCI